MGAVGVDGVIGGNVVMATFIGALALAVGIIAAEWYALVGIVWIIETIA